MMDSNYLLVAYAAVFVLSCYRGWRTALSVVLSLILFYTLGTVIERTAGHLFPGSTFLGEIAVGLAFAPVALIGMMLIISNSGRD